MRVIELPKQTIEALLNDTSMFIEPIKGFIGIKTSKEHEEEAKKSFIRIMSKLQIGGEFFIQEDFCEDAVEIYYKNTSSLECANNTDWVSAKKMNARQSRYKGVVVDVEVNRVQDLVLIDGMFIDYVNFLDNEVYEDNPYVFLYTVKRISND